MSSDPIKLESETVRKMIPFNKPYITGQELNYIQQALNSGKLAGDGPFSQKCEAFLQEYTGCQKVLLTPSCTAALEMAAILLNIKPGDEVIMPSFTFVSTATAFVLRGGIPVFVDIRRDTLNIDESLIEASITTRTRAIVVVHYAGVPCEMNIIMDIASRHGFQVVEDAAQGISSTYHGKALGTIGHLGTYSFHGTKNVVTGEGGCLLVNDPELALRAEIIRETGTNRTQFLRGEIEQYTWTDLGSSFLVSDVTAAFLWAQLEAVDEMTQSRLTHWNYYKEQLKSLEDQGKVRLPGIPEGCQHNAHIFYVVLSSEAAKLRLLNICKEMKISLCQHYSPLHSSPGGRNYGRTYGEMSSTDEVANGLVRLPLWIGISRTEQDSVIEVLYKELK